MLKDISEHYPNEISSFLRKWVDTMSNVTIRYAAELLPKELRP